MTYVTLCRNLLWQWCLKSTKPRLLSTHLFPPNRYVCFAFFGSSSFSFQVVYMSLIHYFIWNWHIYICYFICRPLLMHRCLKSTKPAAHRSLTSRYVYLDRFLCRFVYTSQDQVTFNMYPLFGHVTCFICTGHAFFVRVIF